MRLLVQRHHDGAQHGGAIAFAIEQAMAKDTFSVVCLDQPGAGGGAAGIEHLALEIDLEPADHDAKAWQAAAHDLAHIGDTGRFPATAEKAPLLMWPLASTSAKRRFSSVAKP